MSNDAEKRKPGRPTKLTPELHTRFIEALRSCEYVELACAIVGVDKRTVYEWIKLGAKGESPEHVAFRHAVKEARAQAAAQQLAHIAKAAGAGEWTAAAWRLERSFPHLFGRNVGSLKLENEKLRQEIELLKAKREQEQQGQGDKQQPITVVVQGYSKKPEGEGGDR
jgi:hypothetical protein